MGGAPARRRVDGNPRAEFPVAEIPKAGRYAAGSHCTLRDSGAAETTPFVRALAAAVR